MTKLANKYHLSVDLFLHVISLVPVPNLGHSCAGKTTLRRFCYQLFNVTFIIYLS